MTDWTISEVSEWSNGGAFGDDCPSGSKFYDYRLTKPHPTEPDEFLVVTDECFVEKVSNEEDPFPYAVSNRTEFIVCTDPDDPGGTGLRSDCEYTWAVTSIGYETLEAAERDARRMANHYRWLAENMDTIDWDGGPIR